MTRFLPLLAFFSLVSSPTTWAHKAFQIPDEIYVLENYAYACSNDGERYARNIAFHILGEELYISTNDPVFVDQDTWDNDPFWLGKVVSLKQNKKGLIKMITEGVRKHPIFGVFSAVFSYRADRLVVRVLVDENDELQKLQYSNSIGTRYWNQSMLLDCEGSNILKAPVANRAQSLQHQKSSQL